MFDLAVLATVFNRREVTLRCLESIRNWKCKYPVKITVYLVDDGSSDGTSEAIKEHFPETVLIQGNGSLFWNGGMRLALDAAIKSSQKHNFYLLINDDSNFYLDCLDILIDRYNEFSDIPNGSDVVIVGAMCDPKTKELAYGGRRQCGVFKKTTFRLVELTDDNLECDTMNGNCVLIPSSVVDKIGNFDPAFIQNMGDYDYGLRARRVGARIFSTKNFVGECEKNLMGQEKLNRNLPIKERFKFLLSEKGLKPSCWVQFCRRYAGPFWILYFLRPYAKELFRF